MSIARKELLETIEQQRVRITKYEAKIKDVVNAYKSLAKEKQALQASLTALTSGSQSQHKDGTHNDDVGAAESESGNDQCDANSEASSELRAGSESSSLDFNLQQSKISALTTSLQTLTAEKIRMETSLKDDRKRMIEERKQIEEKLKFGEHDWQQQKKEFESKLQDMKSKIIILQNERENDSSNAMVMLREMESRFTFERKEREKLEKNLEEISDQNRRLSLAVNSRNDDKKHQKQITDLQNELEQVRCRLKIAEEQCKEPPVLKSLQVQMNQMKEQYTDAVYQEKVRAEAAESSSRDLSQVHEDRVVALEASLTELSHTAATYDRTKQTHLQIIDALKERIAQLAEENTTLSEIGRSNLVDSKLTNSSCSLEKEDLKSLVWSFQSIWKQLKTRQNKQSGFNIEDFLEDDSFLHIKCTSNIKQLEAEIRTLQELYPSPTFSSNKECCCGLKQQVAELKDRVRSLNTASHLTQTTHSEQVKTLTEELTKLKVTNHKRALATEQDHRASVSQLEQQLAEHCQRSLATLQDRDQEIHRLSKEVFDLKQEAKAQPSTVAAALLSQVNSGADGPLLHHLEELARKELEVINLRRQKLTLEKSMREIQMMAIEKQQAMHEDIDELQEQVERHERNTSREGENLEYLKNIVLNYMTSSEVEAKLTILKAIAAVLKFTPSEIESAKKSLSVWWWQANSQKKGPHRIRSPSVSYDSRSTSKTTSVSSYSEVY